MEISKTKVNVFLFIEEISHTQLTKKKNCLCSVIFIQAIIHLYSFYKAVTGKKAVSVWKIGVELIR